MNKICIIGNLTKDPEVRSTPNGLEVCNFVVAVNRRKTDKNGEELPALFYRVTAWRKLAEICGKFLKKGSKVYAEGDLNPSLYKGNDGQARISLDIDAQTIEFLSNVQGNGERPTESVQKDEQTGFAKVDDEGLPF